MIICRIVPVEASDAAALIRAYVTELVDRWHGRTMPVEQVDEAMALVPVDDLTFFVAYRDGAAVGCAGLCTVRPDLGEVKRVYVVPHARRLGVGRQLLDALERHARAAGMTSLRLDTRHDLVEARALYARHGYTDIPAFNDDPYVQHWFGKDLRQPLAQTVPD